MTDRSFPKARKLSDESEQTMVVTPEVPFFDGMDFGVGINTASGSARNTAATGDASTIPQAGGSIVSFHMEQVETVTDLLTSLDVSAKASGGIGLFSASARFDFAQSCKVHSSSVFLIVSVRVTEAFQSIKKPGIEPEAAELLKKGNTDRFLELYGDRFVRGIKTGGQFFGVVQVLTQDQDDSRKVAAGLTASYSAFSASGTFDSKFEETVKNHRTIVTCYIEGGQSLHLPTSIDTMTEAAVSFPEKLTGHAVPYLALLNDYGVLPLPQAPNFIDLQHQKDVLTECARLRDLHQLWLNEVDYISEKPHEFVNVDGDKLNKLRADVSADLDAIAKSATLALEDPKAATYPMGLLVTVPQLPARVENAAVPGPQVGQGWKQRIATGVPPIHALASLRGASTPVPTMMALLVAEDGSLWKTDDAVGGSIAQHPTPGRIVSVGGPSSIGVNSNGEVWRNLAADAVQSKKFDTMRPGGSGIVFASWNGAIWAVTENGSVWTETALITKDSRWDHLETPGPVRKIYRSWGNERHIWALPTETSVGLFWRDTSSVWHTLSSLACRDIALDVAGSTLWMLESDGSITTSKGDPTVRTHVSDGDFVSIAGGFKTHTAMALRADGTVWDLH